MKNLKKRKAHGNGKITNLMLQKLHRKEIVAVTNIANGFMTTEHFQMKYNRGDSI